MIDTGQGLPGNASLATCRGLSRISYATDRVKREAFGDIADPAPLEDTYGASRAAYPADFKELLDPPVA
jgi:hypothetical protein